MKILTYEDMTVGIVIYIIDEHPVLTNSIEEYI